eukprot:UN31910
MIKHLKLKHLEELKESKDWFQCDECKNDTMIFRKRHMLNKHKKRYHKSTQGENSNLKSTDKKTVNTTNETKNDKTTTEQQQTKPEDNQNKRKKKKRRSKQKNSTDDPNKGRETSTVESTNTSPQTQNNKGKKKKKDKKLKIENSANEIEIWCQTKGKTENATTF